MNDLLGEPLAGLGTLSLLQALGELLLHYLHVFVSLVRALLNLLEVHVKRLGVALDLLNSLDDLFLEYLLPLFHFVDFLV